MPTAATIKSKDENATPGGPNRVSVIVRQVHRVTVSPGASTREVLRQLEICSVENVLCTAEGAVLHRDADVTMLESEALYVLPAWLAKHLPQDCQRFARGEKGEDGTRDQTSA